MKNLAYKIYALSFNTFAHLPIARNKVALLSPHMASFTDSLGEMEKEMLKRGYKTVRVAGSDIKPSKLSFRSVFRMMRFFVKGAFDLATSSIVFMNDNFMPLADLHVNSKAVFVQLWHAEGAFKQFGLDIDGLAEDVRERVRKGNQKLSFVICSGPGVTEVYASAFGVAPEKVKPLGSPRADRYIASSKEMDVKTLRKNLFGDTDKKVVLYAPTFRDDSQENKVLLEQFDFEAFNRKFSDKYMLVLRLHPQFGRNTIVPEGVPDFTAYPNGGDLISASDILITDYSSICMDFAIVGKPSVFYAFDLEKYCKDRNFYFDYKKYVPGAVAETFEDLLSAMESVETDRDALNQFVDCNFGVLDGKSTERIADLAITEANSKSR